jgi:hypothetical protein
MSISRITALIIQTNGDNIRAEVQGQDSTTGKYTGCIAQYKNGERHTTLASSAPTFNNREEAITAMEALIEIISKHDLSLPSDD